MKKLMRLLPSQLRYSVYRRMLNTNDYHLPEVTYKIADTEDEVEEALELVYKKYKKEGLVDQDESKIRATKYHLSPKSIILIGKYKGKIICTLTVVVDSSLGMPIDKAVNLNELRKKQNKIAEISSLSVEKCDFPKGALLFNLLKYMWQYVNNYTHVDTLACAVKEKAADYYIGLLLFEKLDLKSGVNYDFVKDAKPLTLYLDLNTAEKRYSEVYDALSEHHNLYKFFKKNTSNFIFPEKQMKVLKPYCLSEETIEKIFIKRTQVLNHLKEEELINLTNDYFLNSYKKLFKMDKKITFIRMRKEPRFESNLIFQSKKHKISGRVTCLSQGGVKLELSNYGILDDKPLDLEVQLSQGTMTKLKLQKSWEKGNHYGFKVIQSDISWTEMVDYLSETINCQKSKNLKKAS